MESIDALVRQFAVKVEAVVRQEVAAEIEKHVKRVLGAEPRSAGRRARVAPARPGKRMEREIERAKEKLLRFIAAHPGLRAEQIAEGTGISTALMALPIKKLLREKKIKASGVARGTTYVLA